MTGSVVSASSRRHAREWRQFRLLFRDSLRRLLDRVVVSRDADPAQFALWAAVLAMAPPLAFSVLKMTQFSFWRAVHAADPTITSRILDAERMFFVLYGMLVATLLAALTWEALFPDRDDQEILGALPVRPRVLACARLCAVAGANLLVAAGINLPAALFYSVGSLALGVGPWPAVLAGHVAATMFGSMFVLVTAIASRAVAAIVAGERIASRLAVLLQFAAFVLMVESVLFLPYVVFKLVAAMKAAGSTFGGAPPVWFAALYAWIADGTRALEPLAVGAIAATLAIGAGAVVLSLAPAAWMGRRALQVRSRHHASPVMVATRTVALAFTRRPAVAAMFLFAVASLTRSRRHALVVARYAGMSIAAAILMCLSAILRGTFQVEEPRPYLLAIPLVFIFFTVLGLRTAIALPADLDANWPFRLSTPTADAAVRAARLFIFSVGLVPILVVWVLITLPVWPVATVLRIAALDLAVGLLVIEASLMTWTKIPFATTHEPSPETLKWRWMGYLAILIVVGRGGSTLQFDIIQSTRTTVACIVAAFALVVVVRWWRARQQQARSATFDAPAGTIESLNLFEPV